MPNALSLRLLAVLAAVVTIGLASIACADADAATEVGDDAPVAVCDDLEAIQATVSFADDVQMVFDFNCVACHQTGAANAGLNLEFGLAYEQLVEVDSSQSELPLVARGDPNGSYLMHKLWGTQAEVGGSGGIMPLGLGGLPEREIETVATWILECALEN